MDDRDADARLDAVLVERALREADTRAFEMLVRRHQGLVRAQLRRLLGDDPATADDLAQEAFALAWRKLAQFRGESRFSTWIYRIAYSCFLQFLRSRSGREPTLPFDPEHEGSGANEGGLDLRMDLTAAMRRLSGNQRAVLLYCVQLGLSHEEAAEVLDMPLGTVKTHCLRGKAKLRELLKDWDPLNERSELT
jgi:RNA polymerase sigma-70 factor (ECF subfamily)